MKFVFVDAFRCSVYHAKVIYNIVIYNIITLWISFRIFFVAGTYINAKFYSSTSIFADQYFVHSDCKFDSSDLLTYSQVHSRKKWHHLCIFQWWEMCYLVEEVAETSSVIKWMMLIPMNFLSSVVELDVRQLQLMYHNRCNGWPMSVVWAEQ